ncbi:hypothetical protein PISMIDRAFT_10197 [Pisolithus microcarpus 441]|uniref:Uncharacterized protein n=1 Tax=Pisolithus microcarpus 441 TaxID=765257 RepID=A0A0C9ZQK9_9AGAM|nr:hypothetical protein PISMIDRAFT_10197 [Pisolithus microcarpus 441]
MYNAFDWYDHTLEDREDHYAGFLVCSVASEAAWVLMFPWRLSRGGYPHGPDRDFSNQDLYADYPGPSSAHGGLRMDNYDGQQIMVRNVGAARVPFAIALTGWTMLAFLVDGKRGSCRAIKTTGQGKLTETLFDGTRSKGCRVLQFTQVPLASPNFNAIRRSSFGCALRRSLAYLFAVGRQGWTSYAHASGWLRGRARRPQRRSPSSYTLLLLVSLTFEKNG